MAGLEFRIEGNGEIPLIIETGIGNSFYDWYPLIEELKDNFMIVLYHRSGYGKSHSPKAPRTTRNIAKELDFLVDQLGFDKPFILLGHSFGGLCVQHYARMFPDRLKGVVLIDSTSHHFQELYDLNVSTMNSLISIDQMAKSCRDTAEKSVSELKSMNTAALERYGGILSKTDIDEYVEFISNPRLYKTAADEFENWSASSFDIENSGSFPDVPLTVIARDKEFAARPWIEHNIPEKEAILYEECWRGLQAELSKLSTKGELIIAENSDHSIHRDRPDIVVQALNRFIS